MWIRTRDESVYKKYKEYYDKYVMKYGARVCDPFPSDIEKLLTKERVKIDKLHEMLNPSQRELVDDDMINVQQLILDNPNEVNAKLRQFLHDIGNEDEVPTSASAAHPPPPHDSLSSQWAPPPPHDSLSQYAPPPPPVASAPPMDDDPQYPPSQYAPPYTPPHAPPPSYAPPPPYPPPPHAPPPSYPPPPYLPPLGPSAPPMDPPPPLGPSAPHMDEQYGYFDIHGNRSIIPGNGRLRRI